MFRKEEAVIASHGLVRRGPLGGVGELEAEPRALAFRSLDSFSGELQTVFSPTRGARVLELREVSYRFEPGSEGPTGTVVKQIDRQPRHD